MKFNQTLCPWSLTKLALGVDKTETETNLKLVLVSGTHLGASQNRSYPIHVSFEAGFCYQNAGKLLDNIQNNQLLYPANGI